MLTVMLALALAGAEQPKGSTRFIPCEIKDVDGDVRCGTIEVAENRSAPTGRRIPLYVVVLKSKSQRPAAADAFFALQGGPGQSATQLADFYARLLAQVRDDLDVVLVDVRGTGRSNALQCELHPKNSQSFDLFPLEPLKQCRADLEQKADLRQYTTANIVADLDEVRRELGYDQVHFYGTSYGTRVALEYLRQHPSRVKTLTLKGVVPPSGTMPLRHAPDGQEALDAVLARCRADQSCHSAFPHLRRALYALLDQLRATPRRAAIKASDGQDREVLITAGLFGEALRNMLYTPETIARVPLILTNAARGDMSELATIVDRTKAVLNGAISVGMFLSVTCTEDVPFIEEHRIEMAAVFGDFRIRQQQQACSVWTRGTVPADFRSPVHSDRPALLISGELDPATPPRSAAEVARGLPNSLQVVVRHNGHPMGALQPCASKMIAVLTREGTTKGLDTSCAQMLTLAPFAMPPRLDRLQSQQPAAQQRVSGLLRSSETSLSVRSLDSSS